MGVGLFVAGVDTLADSLGIPGALPYLVQLLPCILSLPLCMMHCSTCSISMEGKEFWQLQVLPVKAATVYTAKLLWTLVLAAPFYVVSVVLLILGGKPDVLTALHYILLPLVYLVFTIVLGLAANLRFPVLNWDNEARVVKQSAAVLVSMLVSIITVLAPAVLAVGLQWNNYHGYFFAVEGILLSVTAVLYFFITKKELICIPR